MKQDFLNYIQETFQFSPSEMTEFSCALSRPLRKSIRVNTNKISIGDFKKLSEKNGYILTETSLGKNTFYIDREDTSLPLGHTLEHITGYFYVQELAASSSPFYMSGDKIDVWEYNILDMSASPWGKTTQLAEYYPNATIIANEIDKTRLKQLYENTDRLGSRNVFVTNYDGRFFGNYPEIFDKILLDAPCSGEGTAYKTDDALKFWNLKNIKRIAKLQAQLLESALISLKIGGEIVYSTCTLNRLENEEIIQSLLEKYPEEIEVFPLWWSNFIRAWPHIIGTGGFFVAKLRKKNSLNISEWKKKKLQKHIQGFSKVGATDEKEIRKFLRENFWLEIPGKFYSYRNEIYYTQKNIDFFWENFFLYKCGIKIWSFENGVFTPNFYLGTHFWTFEKQSITIAEETLHWLFQGKELTLTEVSQDGYYQICDTVRAVGLIKVKNKQTKILLENKFMRK